MMLRAGPAYQGCPNPWPSPEARGLIPEACHVYTSLRRSDRLRVRGKDCVPLSAFAEGPGGQRAVARCPQMREGG